MKKLIILTIEKRKKFYLNSTSKESVFELISDISIDLCIPYFFYLVFTLFLFFSKNNVGDRATVSAE